MMITFLGRRPQQAVLACALLALSLTALFWFYLQTEDGASRFRGASLSKHPFPAKQLKLLPAYDSRTEEQQRCERMFGTTYLTHVASHQHPYCEPDSGSHIQCFSAPRLPAPWKSDWTSEAGDPLCVVRGVTFEAEGPPAKRFTAHCRQRNFTEERKQLQRRQQKSSGEDITGVLNLEDLPVYWFDTGIGAQMGDWDFDSHVDGCGAGATNDTDWILLVRRENNGNIWHKLMELWQSVVTIDALQIAINPATGTPWLSREAAASVRTVFEDERDDVLDSLWPVINGRTPERRSAFEPGSCLSNVILPLAGSSSPFWAALLENVHHSGCADVRALADAFISRVLRLLDIAPRAYGDVSKHPAITIINRTTHRKIHDLDRLVDLLRDRHPNSTVNVVDFAAIPIAEQVRLAQSTDVLVGHHGAGLTHILFLRPGSAVVEIATMPGTKFRSISAMRGMSHFEVRCLEPEEFALAVDGTALPEGWQPGHNDATWQTHEWVYLTDEMWLGSIDAAVQNQLNRRYMREPWLG